MNDQALPSMNPPGDALPLVPPREEEALPTVAEAPLPLVPSSNENALPTVESLFSQDDEEDALPLVGFETTEERKERKVKLNKMELPSGYELDPEEWGIDLAYAPNTASSNFATDLEDDEPASLVELPAELREFMNSEEGQKLSPDEVKAMLTEVLKEHLPQAVASVTPAPMPYYPPPQGPPAPLLEPVESKRSLARRAIPLFWVLFFLFQWKLALFFLVPSLLLWWGIGAMKLQKDVGRSFERDVKRWQRTGKLKFRRF